MAKDRNETQDAPAEVPGPAEHVLENRAFWDGMADDWVAAGERAWRRAEPAWGNWQIPESQLGLLPSDMTGMRAIELGCGTGYVSAWMARRGADVVAVDNSVEQLRTAMRLNREHGLKLQLIHGNAETVPCPDARFDFAFSEFGAAIWCDPVVWIPEAWRLLKPGGRLTFLGSHPLAIITTPESGAASDERLHRSYFGMHRLDWRRVPIDPGGIEFNLTHSQWLRLFRETGFEVLDYLELQAPATASGTPYSIPAEWAQRWPGEQVWKLRKRELRPEQLPTPR